jgi:hypothetical protein
MKTINDRQRAIRFTAVLIFALAFCLLIQSSVFGFVLEQHLLGDAYLFNGLFALVSFVFLLIINKKNPGIAGFAFMGSSALKFLIFFQVFYPVYYADGSIVREEFLSFFVPYSVALTVELVFFIRN